MKNTVIFLIEAHFLKWHETRFGLEILKSNGIRFLILDFTKFLFPKYYERFASQTDENHNVILVKDLHELSNIMKIQTPSRMIVFDNLGFSWKTNRLRRVIFSYPHTMRATWSLGNLPVEHTNWAFALYLELKSKRSLYKAALNLFWRKTSTVFGKDYDLVLLSGLKSHKRFSSVRHKIWCHAFDYDEFLKEGGNTSPQKTSNGYIVYLDEDLLSHPDNYHGNNVDPVDVEFYALLEKNFQQIEAQFAKPIIIAAHPKREKIHPDCFGKRSIIWDRTSELVKNADLVLGHASCSFNFAVIWKKPIVIMASESLLRSSFGPLIKGRATSVNAPIKNLSDLTKKISKKSISVDVRAYEECFVDFVKVSSDDGKLVWQIFADYVNRSLNEGTVLK